MFLMSLINYQALLDQIHWFYIAGVASLMAVMLFGQKYLGARRWVKMPGGNHFQPSEWVKLILILAVAKYFADMRQRELSWPDFMKAGAIVGIPMLMVLAQPDLGTALTYFPIAVMGVFLGGLQWKQGRRWVCWRRSRLARFPGSAGARAEVVPEAAPDQLYGSGTRIRRARGTKLSNPRLRSVRGGFGAGKARKHTLAFLPVPQTDFIFAAFAEEHGFVGALGVLLLYFIVLMRLTQNAQTAPDRAGTFVVMGVVAVLSFHILVNVGMVVGFMPVTGIPLPLMSYGGSSVLFMFLALGMVMNVRMRRFVN